MSTKPQPSKEERSVGNKAMSMRPRSGEAVVGVWEKLPAVLRQQLTLQVADLLHKVASHPVTKGMDNE